jgi:hypothetical protein
MGPCATFRFRMLSSWTDWLISLLKHYSLISIALTDSEKVRRHSISAVAGLIFCVKF